MKRDHENNNSGFMHKVYNGIQKNMHYLIGISITCIGVGAYIGYNKLINKTNSDSQSTVLPQEINSAKVIICTGGSCDELEITMIKEFCKKAGIEDVQFQYIDNIQEGLRMAKQVDANTVSIFAGSLSVINNNKYESTANNLHTISYLDTSIMRICKLKNIESIKQKARDPNATTCIGYEQGSNLISIYSDYELINQDGRDIRKNKNHKIELKPYGSVVELSRAIYNNEIDYALTDTLTGATKLISKNQNNEEKLYGVLSGPDVSQVFYLYFNKEVITGYNLLSYLKQVVFDMRPEIKEFLSNKLQTKVIVKDDFHLVPQDDPYIQTDVETQKQLLLELTTTEQAHHDKIVEIDTLKQTEIDKKNTHSSSGDQRALKQTLNKLLTLEQGELDEIVEMIKVKKTKIQILDRLDHLPQEELDQIKQQTENELQALGDQLQKIENRIKSINQEIEHCDQKIYTSDKTNQRQEQLLIKLTQLEQVEEEQHKKLKALTDSKQQQTDKINQIQEEKDFSIAIKDLTTLLNLEKQIYGLVQQQENCKQDKLNIINELLKINPQKFENLKNSQQKINNEIQTLQQVQQVSLQLFVDIEKEIQLCNDQLNEYKDTNKKNSDQIQILLTDLEELNISYDKNKQKLQQSDDDMAQLWGKLGDLQEQEGKSEDIQHKNQQVDILLQIQNLVNDTKQQVEDAINNRSDCLDKSKQLNKLQPKKSEQNQLQSELLQLQSRKDVLIDISAELENAQYALLQEVFNMESQAHNLLKDLQDKESKEREIYKNDPISLFCFEADKLRLTTDVQDIKHTIIAIINQLENEATISNDLKKTQQQIILELTKLNHEEKQIKLDRQNAYKQLIEQVYNKNKETFDYLQQTEKDLNDAMARRGKQYPEMLQLLLQQLNILKQEILESQDQLKTLNTSNPNEDIANKIKDQELEFADQAEKLIANISQAQQDFFKPDEESGNEHYEDDVVPYANPICPNVDCNQYRKNEDREQCSYCKIYFGDYCPNSSCRKLLEENDMDECSHCHAQFYNYCTNCENDISQLDPDVEACIYCNYDFDDGFYPYCSNCETGLRDDEIKEDGDNDVCKTCNNPVEYCQDVFCSVCDKDVPITEDGTRCPVCNNDVIDEDGLYIL